MAHQTETIVVPEIHCDHCKNSIEGALRPLTGVDSAVVDVESTNVTVEFDDAAVSRTELVQAITDQGYEVPQ
ncbi:MAG: cation transporter [Euzebya sp.]